ncbi:hypothetical protein BJ508DRAFT_316182 [Ascobolus immersus RN42]|uniref:Uncharacterized protein n=1 Tax=Ascobolus immersus RN42 TaxID=1160509 RepID=A0A3N4HBL3_ASCIM|nr:hypothetical protein BJ508DRAFT_316182 [Ascobolus immersus RN42]
MVRAAARRQQPFRQAREPYSRVAAAYLNAPGCLTRQRITAVNWSDYAPETHILGSPIKNLGYIGKACQAPKNECHRPSKVIERDEYVVPKIDAAEILRQARNLMVPEDVLEWFPEWEQTEILRAGSVGHVVDFATAKLSWRREDFRYHPTIPFSARFSEHLESSVFEGLRQAIDAQECVRLTYEGYIPFNSAFYEREEKGQVPAQLPRNLRQAMADAAARSADTSNNAHNGSRAHSQPETVSSGGDFEAPRTRSDPTRSESAPTSGVFPGPVQQGNEEEEEGGPEGAPIEPSATGGPPPTEGPHGAAPPTNAVTSTGGPPHTHGGPSHVDGAARHADGALSHSDDDDDWCTAVDKLSDTFSQVSLKEGVRRTSGETPHQRAEEEAESGPRGLLSTIGTAITQFRRRAGEPEGHPQGGGRRDGATQTVQTGGRNGRGQQEIARRVEEELSLKTVPNRRDHSPVSKPSSSRPSTTPMTSGTRKDNDLNKAKEQSSFGGSRSSAALVEGIGIPFVIPTIQSQP